MIEQPMETTGGPLYPIREVSRLTGVNSVTLRAWERRYGLIQPRRTPKGHRLYAREDIERVERILQWLNRGVPVSQVGELLDQPVPQKESTPAPASGDDWAGQCQQAIEAIESFDTARLDTLFTRSMGLYPVNTAIAHLWRPVVEQMEERWSETFGACAKRQFFEAFLRTRLGLRLYHGNLEHSEPRLLLCRLPDEPSMLWLLLVAFTASSAGFHVTLFDGAIPLSELSLATEHCRTNAVILVGGQAERSDLIRRQLPKVADKLAVPLCMSGPVARIRAHDLEKANVILLDDDFTHAIPNLRSLIG